MTLIERLRRYFGRATSNGGVAGQATISCADALTLVHEFLDGELEDVSSDRVEAHFKACERCYPHLRLEQTFREALGRATRGETAPPELRAAVLQVLAQDSSRPNVAGDPGS